MSGKVAPVVKRVARELRKRTDGELGDKQVKQAVKEALKETVKAATKQAVKAVVKEAAASENEAR